VLRDFPQKGKKPYKTNIVKTGSTSDNHRHFCVQKERCDCVTKRHSRFVVRTYCTYHPGLLPKTRISLCVIISRLPLIFSSLSLQATFSFLKKKFFHCWFDTWSQKQFSGNDNIRKERGEQKEQTRFFQQTVISLALSLCRVIQWCWSTLSHFERETTL
jgi:hypothetical protein